MVAPGRGGHSKCDRTVDQRAQWAYPIRIGNLMHADILTLDKIFTGNVRFQVPMYQRPYVWNQEDQWDPLWSDIQGLADSLLDGEDVAPHFLGAIVVGQQSSPTGDIAVRHVVDGQQRLTTFQLLLDAVEEVIRSYGHEKDSFRIRPLILNDPNLFDGDDRFKVWPTNVDREAYRAAMADEAEIPDDIADQNVAQAHDVFKKKTIAWADVKGDPDKCAERLHALATVLIQRVQVAVIDLAPDDNAQAIFETLNARGTPLLVSDLVKNSVLYESEVLGLDTETLYREHWEAFDHQSWRTEVRMGRFYWPKIDAFIYQWLVMNVAREVPTQQMFNEFGSVVQERGLGPGQIMAELQRFGQIYRFLEDAPDGHDPTGRFFYRWRAMEAGALTPLLLWVYANKEAIGDVEPILVILESWLVRRMICRSTTRGYSHFLHSLLKKFAESEPELAMATISSHLSGAEATGTEWPTDNQVTNAVLEYPIYRQLIRRRLRFVLEAIEDHKHGDKTELKCPVGLTIEHVMPQYWAPNWPLGEDLTGELTQRRDDLVHTLGNLSLVTGKLNPALSNAPWVKKRKILKKHSVLLLNDELLDSDSWDEAAIVKRGEEMAQTICEIWPGPESSTS